jgi:hypothetical protein
VPVTPKAEIKGLFEAGLHDDALARLLELAHGVDRDSEFKVRGDVFLALSAGVAGLAGAGRNQDALRVMDEIRTRYSEEPAPKLRALVVRAFLQMETPIWNSLGEPERALASLDTAWSMVASSDPLIRAGAGVEVLLSKSAQLHSIGRFDEAVVVVDSAMQAIADATSASEAGRTRKALKAIVYKLEDLVALDRGREAVTLGQQLGDLLRGFSSEVMAEEDREERAGSESELARALAQVTGGDAWSELESADRDLTAEELAERAVRLYRIAAPWAVPATTGMPSAVDAAAEVLRNFADGYAMFAVAGGALSPDQRASLPLPRRQDSEASLRAFDVPDWAEAQGHPLTLPDPRTDTNRGAEVYTLERAEEDYFDGRFRQHVTTLTYVYEFLTIIGRFPTGRQAMRDDTVRRTAQQLITVKQAGARLGFVGEASGRTGAAFVGLVIARAVFLASHDEEGAKPIPFPSVAQLREILHETGGYDWLSAANTGLPPWTDLEH